MVPGVRGGELNEMGYEQVEVKGFVPGIKLSEFGERGASKMRSRVWFQG